MQVFLPFFLLIFNLLSVHVGSKVRSKVVGKKKRVQVRWSQSEKDAVERHLHGHILRKIVPGKEMILRCLQQEKLSLSGRTWRNIRDYCRNRTVWDKHA